MISQTVIVSVCVCVCDMGVFTCTAAPGAGLERRPDVWLGTRTLCFSEYLLGYAPILNTMSVYAQLKHQLCFLKSHYAL